MLDLSYKQILRVALPLMLSGFIQSVISITDAAFLSRFSGLAYEASGAAGLWYITLYMVFIGLSDGAQIGMAQEIGKNNQQGFRTIFQSNFTLLLFAAVLLFIAVRWIIPGILNTYVVNPKLAAAQQEFLKIRGYAFFAACISLSVQASFLAIGKTRIVLYTSLLVAFSNVLLDYLLVFGIGSFPRMGLAGAAWASTLAEALGAIFLVFYFFKNKRIRSHELFQRWMVTFSSLRGNLSISIPLIFQGLIALSIWTVFFMWIEQMGGENLPVSLNIRYIYFLAFIPIWGFAGAAKTYIAQYFGSGNLDEIPRIQRRIQLLTVLFLLVTFHGALLYPQTLIRLVSDNPQHIEVSAAILRLVFGSIIIYALGSVYFQTVSAIGHTRITLIIECCATCLYIVSAFLFIKVWHWEILYVWMVEYVYFITMGTIAFLYIKRSNWKLKAHSHG